MADRKHWRLIPDLYLKLGPDRYHPARIGPLPVGVALDLLSGWLPGDLYRATYDTEATLPKGITHDLLADAICEWNSTWGDDEDGDRCHSMDGWQWLGLAIRAKDEGVDLWIALVDGDRPVCDLGIDGAHLDGAARAAAQVAYATLATLFNPSHQDKGDA